MAFDAFFLSAVMDEIRDRTAEARVDKIHQPSRDTVILHLWKRNTLLSIAGGTVFYMLLVQLVF